MGAAAKRRRTTLTRTPAPKSGAKQAVARELAEKHLKMRNGQAAAEVARDLQRGEDPIRAIGKTRRGAKAAAKKATPGKRVKGQTRTG